MQSSPAIIAVLSTLAMNSACTAAFTRSADTAFAAHAHADRTISRTGFGFADLAWTPSAAIVDADTASATEAVNSDSMLQSICPDGTPDIIFPLDPVSLDLHALLAHESPDDHTLVVLPYASAIEPTPEVSWSPRSAR